MFQMDQLSASLSPKTPTSTMMSSVGFYGNVPLKRSHEKHVTLAAKTTCRFGLNRGLKLTLANGKVQKLCLGGPTMAFGRNIWSNDSSDSDPISPSETIKEFYKCINDGKSKELRDYISNDCHIDECSYPVPFRGKKEVLQFFDQLIEGLGENVRFKVNKVYEGDELVVAANWHLEWKETTIPFTRGGSFFECRKEGDKIIIKKAQIVIESPVKPGGLVLQLLKIVTKVFDNFPSTAGWFLKSHQVILQMFLRIYSVFFTIFFNPFLKSYLQIWNLTSQLQGPGFKIIHAIIKFLTK